MSRWFPLAEFPFRGVVLYIHTHIQMFMPTESDDRQAIHQRQCRPGHQGGARGCLKPQSIAIFGHSPAHVADIVEAGRSKADTSPF